MYKDKTLKGFVVAQTPIKTFLEATRYCQYKELPLVKENVIYDISRCKELSSNRVNEIEYIEMKVDKQIKECKTRITRHIDIIHNSKDSIEVECNKEYLTREQGIFHALIDMEDILVRRKWELYEISKLKNKEL